MRPHESERSATVLPAAQFVMVAFQLLLVLAVVHLFDIEGQRHFFPVMCVVVCGFLVHTWLPVAYRTTFFAMLSVGSVLLVLGFANGAWVICIGGGLLAICYLRVGFAIRISLLLVVGAVLVYLRARFVMSFWTVLGSMFMFRLIVYVYDNRRASIRPPLFESLSYFFMLPNICFPLFPVVDYRTFRESYYNEDEWTIYQRGVTWIIRGIAHLMIYRYINYYLIPAPYELTDLTHVVLFMVTNYGLYLRVSGQFHLITGILHLFGFNLPRTHFLFFLASSFNDIWRRINIYWKDFMMKLFFFPAYFVLRRQGARPGTAVVVAVIFVFVCTWLLHSWQMFWLRGVFPLSAKVAALWLCTGTLVAANSWFEYRRSARRIERKKRPWLWRATTLSLRTIGMFTTVSFFWACWTRPGFARNLWELLQDAPVRAHDVWAVMAAISALVCVGVAAQFAGRVFPAGRFAVGPVSLSQSMKFNAMLLAALVSVGLPGFRKLFDSKTSEAIAEFQSDSLTTLEVANQMQGYYEDLNAAAIQAGPFLKSLSPEEQAEGRRGWEYAHLTRRADALLETELIPGVRGELDGSPISINQFGMRDRETITLRKPANTIRIALVGSSVVMGYGVNDDEVFSRMLETRLNAGRSQTASRYEVLNFGTGKYDVIQQHAYINRKVFSFQPDALYYFAHQNELYGRTQHLAKLIYQETELPSDSFRKIARRAGITPGMAWGAIEGRLGPFNDEIVREGYRSIVRNCRHRGIIPVWIYLPIPGVPDAPDPSDRVIPMAEEAGFVVLDLTDWPQGHRLTEVKRTADDQHPNARGHRLIGEALYNALKEHPDALPGRR